MKAANASPELRFRRTKIIATLGPATSGRGAIAELIAGGVDLFRLNLSHGTHDDHRATCEAIREAAAAQEREIAVLADLCGPKIRVGAFESGSILLADEETVTITTRDVPGRAGLIPSQYAALAGDVKPGDRILLDDGALELRVTEIAGSEISCLVVAGGVLREHKGMNLPGVAVSSPALTGKDRADARFALSLGVDFLALSFVRRPEDIADLRRLVGDAGYDVPIISKIEKPEALENIEAIVEASDGIMIARGDLGVELPPEMVPHIQEELVDLARARTRPVIVATQMLESMIDNPRPTRAEVTDVANAVRSGADAVMLSGETAVGRHAPAAVRMMDAIVRRTEDQLFAYGAFGGFDAYTPTGPAPERPSIDCAVAGATAALTRDLEARALVVVTHSGRSMAVMSAARPATEIIGVSADPRVVKLGCLLWGVLPTLASARELEDGRALAYDLARRYGQSGSQPNVLLVQGFSPRHRENRPRITVLPIADI